MKTWDQPSVKISNLPMEQLVELIRLQLREGGIAPLTVTGSSMHPTFRHRRDTVMLSVRQPHKYDVILYKRDDGDYILHRIVREENGFVCCGDNQWQPESVREDQIIAVVVSFDRKGKRYDEDHCGYRLWVRFWTGLYPIRRPILAVRHGLGRVWRALVRRKIR